MALFNDIATTKDEPRRSLLLALCAQVHAAYLAYEGLAPDVHTLVPPTPTASEREALLHCYDTQTKLFAHVYQEIFESTYFCPYCEIVKVQTLDHFLDKSTYPNLAVLPLNLVPACVDCNRPRPNGIVTNGERCLMHPYFDVGPTNAVLRASIHREGIRWRAVFQMGDSVPAAPAAPDLYQRHHHMLKLMPRYNSWAEQDAIPSIRSTVVSWGTELGPDRATAKLHDQTIALRGTYGANHPKVVIHRAAAEHADFVRVSIEEGP